jgi:geranylgeranyl pyrophosphate synthase/predicted secreted hydrolase
VLVDTELQQSELLPDWPGPGPVDLELHDLPHSSSTLEWWYVNGHLTDDLGREFGFFASFFRTAVARDSATGEYVYAHALTWALVDCQGKRYLAESLLDKDAPSIVRERLDQGKGAGDDLLRRAFREMADRDRIPGPDTLMTEAALVSPLRFELDYQGRRFEKLGPDRYRLSLASADGGFGCRLDLELTKPAVRHGAQGLVQGAFGGGMFYYFVPRCRLTGAVTVDHHSRPLAEGWGWYDHEFGLGGEFAPDQEETPEPLSWNWLGAQLDDGSDLSVYCLYSNDGQELIGRHALLVDPRGNHEYQEDVSFEPDGEWTSSKTFVRYPTRYHVRVPAWDLALDVQPVMDHQEFVTHISRPAFWEGRVQVEGERRGSPVGGRGFIERTGFETVETMDAFLSAVGRETRHSVQAMLPLVLDHAAAIDVVASADRAEYLQDVDLSQLSEALIQPIRTIVDRAGKAWRSYITLACCDAVGGNSQPILSWLAVPELIHVGSLIVDDVEDSSTLRRGGPSAHLLYGQPLAINAGSICYFLPETLLRTRDLSDGDRVRIYQLYFDSMRAAHCGQALDLLGCQHRLAEVVESGRGEDLERHVRAVYRLKSAAPASALGRVGAIVGGGTLEQVDGLGKYLDRLGVGFQIVDDVLNLRGFENDLKSVGEDISEAKVTMPVAKAMSRLSLNGRRELWQRLTARSTDPDSIGSAIRLIGDCGALTASEEEAQDLVETGWAELEPLLPDTHVKAKMRAFGWYLLDRHY